MSERENKTIAYYNENAAEFQKSIVSADMFETCDRFLAYFTKPSFILDLGCGTGRDSQYFLTRGHRVLPVDASAAMCKIATETTGIKARQIKFEELDYAEVFDGVWACASLLHSERDKLPDVLKKINRALKPSGILYMSFKYGRLSEERNGRFFTDMTENDLPFLCNEDNGFEIKEYFISADVRPERSNEKWLNIIAQNIFK